MFFVDSFFSLVWQAVALLLLKTQCQTVLSLHSCCLSSSVNATPRLSLGLLLWCLGPNSQHSEVLNVLFARFLCHFFTSLLGFHITGPLDRLPKLTLGRRFFTRSVAQCCFNFEVCWSGVDKASGNFFQDFPWCWL